MLNISCMFSICASIIFPRFESSLLSLFWILFWLYCLSPLHLVVLEFYLIPSSGTYSSAISSCLTFCDCVFHSAVWSIVFLLASAVCSLVNEAKRLVQHSWWDGLVLPTGGWSWVLSLCWAGPCQWVCLSGSCVLRKTLSILSADDVELCSHPVSCLAWGISALEPTGCWLGLGLVEKLAASRGLTPISTSQKYCCQCPYPCSEPQLPPSSAGDPLILAGKSAQSHMRSPLFPWVQCAWDPVCAL